MTVSGAREQITSTVTQWENVKAREHRFDGTEYMLGKREIGHIHGDVLVDIPFPKKVRDVIVVEDRAKPHYVLPESGWVSFYIREPADVARAVALLRESFELASKQRRRRQ